MSNDISLSIVITTYERDIFLNKTLDSIFLSINGNSRVETILLDNCSKNKNIQNIANKYSELKFIKNSVNLGLFGNWNKAFEVSSGEYVYILGDDDLVEPEFINEILAMIENKRVDILFTNYSCIDHNDEPVNMVMPIPYGFVHKTEAIKFALDYGLGLPTISMCYKRSLMDEHKFDEKNFGSNDWMLLYKELPWEISFGLNKKLIKYRKHGNGASDKFSDICCVSRFILLWELNNKKMKISKSFILEGFDAERAFHRSKDIFSENIYIKKFEKILYKKYVFKIVMKFAYFTYKFKNLVRNF